MIVSYENVELKHPNHPILSEVNLHISEGELIYIVGVVGSGKTSLLRSMYGELTPMGGKAEVLGTDMMKLRRSQLPALRRKIGMDFQDFHFLPDYTVCENLDFVLKATGWKEKDKRRCRIIEVLEQVGMPERINSHIYELSGGEKQRISIARAILNSPRLILADEPTCNLDRASGNHIIQLLNSLRQDGSTVIITTHNMAWPELYPGTVYCCEAGHFDRF